MKYYYINFFLLFIYFNSDLSENVMNGIPESFGNLANLNDL